MTDMTQAQIDAAELALVKARLAVVEAKFSSAGSKVKAWLGTNTGHLVTWAGVAAIAIKVFGVVL